MWSQQSAICTACVSQASLDRTVRMNRGVPWVAKMEEPVSKTNPIHTTTAVTVLHTSPEDCVRMKYAHHVYQPAHIHSVTSRPKIKCVMRSVTTMNAGGMEETAHSTGSILGSTARLVCPAGIASRMGNVIKSATMLGASLTALSARIPQQPPANITRTVQTTTGTASVTRAATLKVVAGMAWTALPTIHPVWRMAP